MSETPAPPLKIEAKSASPVTENEKGPDTNLLAKTKDRARNLGASLKERFGKSNQTPEQKIQTIAEIRTQQDTILDNRGKNPQGWKDQLRATQTAASEITNQTAEPTGQIASDNPDVTPTENKTIIGRLGEKLQNRWTRKAPEQGMKPKQKTPDADAFIKTESPEVTRYRELMRENWVNQDNMSFTEFHDAKDKALLEAFGPPKSKDSSNSTMTETSQQKPAETSKASTSPDTNLVTQAPETTNSTTSPTDLADKTAQFDSIKDLYDQGRLTKVEYNAKIANLKNPLPLQKTDNIASNSTADSPTEAYYREQHEAETDMQQAKTLMEKKLNALGLAKNRDEDPRWKEAFKESFETAKMSLDSSIGEGAWTAQYKKIVADSRAYADRALEQQNKEHFDAYVKYGVYESRIIDPESIKILGTITDKPTKADVDRLKQEYPEKAALYQYELKGLGEETEAPADGTTAEAPTAEAAKEQTTPDTLLEKFGVNMGSDGARKLVDAMKTNPDVSSAISLLGNELTISLDSAEGGSDSNVKNRFLQILLALAAALGITLLGATKITGEAANAADKTGN